MHGRSRTRLYLSVHLPYLASASLGVPENLVKIFVLVVVESGRKQLWQKRMEMEGAKDADGDQESQEDNDRDSDKILRIVLDCDERLRTFLIVRDGDGVVCEKNTNARRSTRRFNEKRKETVVDILFSSSR